MFGFNSYKLTEKAYIDFPDFENRIVGAATRYYLLTNIFGRLPEVFLDESTQNPNEIKILGREENERVEKFILRDYIIDHENLDKWKVLISKANGTGKLGETLSTPLIGRPGLGHTQTFISLGAFDTEEEANKLLKYIKTKFARTMLGVKKITQDNATAEVWSKVPLQDFTPQSDIDWTKTIPEIDQQLYTKYGLDQTEINFIEEKVRSME